jgi:hypothetical protein
MLLAYLFDEFEVENIHLSLSVGLFWLRCINPVLLLYLFDPTLIAPIGNAILKVCHNGLDHLLNIVDLKFQMLLIADVIEHYLVSHETVNNLMRNRLLFETN